MQPYKSLDAPGLVDDFYLNLIDWSCQNVVAVGFGQHVYQTRFENGEINEVIHLCDFTSAEDAVGAVQFSESGDLIAVGTSRGLTQIWNVQSQKMMIEFDGKSERIGCIAWNDNLVCAGYDNGSVLVWDTREVPGAVMKLRSPETTDPVNRVVHKVCGLKWSPDKQQLGSCGADHTVRVWNLRKPEPCVTFTEHTAHLKAIAWSPHHRGLLTTGGGNRDGMLRFWDTIAGVPLQRVSTGGSQFCNVAWSKHSLELVTTHGYEDNNLITWKFPSLKQEIVQPNPARLVYMAMAPDGDSIVTGNGHECLDFWRVFCRKDDENVEDE